MAEGKIGQDKERKQSRERPSLPEDNRGRDLSRHGNLKKTTEHKVLTSYRRQREGLVKTREESDQARGTDKLETADGDNWGYMSGHRKRRSEEHLLPGDSRRGLVRIRKETD